MIAYWTNFAYTGSPNNSGNKPNKPELPFWSNWSNDEGADKLIILNAGKNGIHMSKEALFKDQLKADLRDDANITNPKERCELYRIMFFPKDMSNYDFSEYLSFGNEGCSL